MLTILQLLIYGFVALVLLPIVIASLASGSKPPPNSFLTKYYEAQPRLMLASNLFLLTVCAEAILRLAEHFGYLDATSFANVAPFIRIPFFMLLLLFLEMFVRAILKVRRDRKAA